MDTNKAHMLARTLMIKHKLDGWHFEFDGAKHRFGSCKHSKKLITLSVALTDLNEKEKVEDTILHEIAHALLGPGYGHGRVFKSKCIEIGCSPSRTYGNEVIRPNSKYIAFCPECNKKFPTNKRYENAWHKKCKRLLGGDCKYLVYEYNREAQPSKGE